MKNVRVFDNAILDVFHRAIIYRLFDTRKLVVLEASKIGTLKKADVEKNIWTHISNCCQTLEDEYVRLCDALGEKITITPKHSMVFTDILKELDGCLLNPAMECGALTNFIISRVNCIRDVYSKNIQ